MKRHPRWRVRARQLLFALACLQVFAPATAAIADAWRMDRRTPYAHIESEGATGCVVVHGDDCLLCSIATSTQARPAAMLSVVSTGPQRIAPADCTVPRASLVRLHLASSRAPPVLHG